MELLTVMEEGPSGLISGVTGGHQVGMDPTQQGLPVLGTRVLGNPVSSTLTKGRAFDSTRPDEESALSLGEGERLPRGPTGGVNSGRGPHPWRGWTLQFPRGLRFFCPLPGPPCCFPRAAGA